MNTLVFLNCSVHSDHWHCFRNSQTFGAVVCFSSIPNPIEISLSLLDVSIFEYNYYISNIALVVSVWYIFRIEFITFDYLKNVDEKNSFIKRGYPHQELNFFLLNYWFAWEKNHTNVQEKKPLLTFSWMFRAMKKTQQTTSLIYLGFVFVCLFGCFFLVEFFFTITQKTLETAVISTSLLEWPS